MRRWVLGTSTASGALLSESGKTSQSITVASVLVFTSVLSQSKIRRSLNVLKTGLFDRSSVRISEHLKAKTAHQIWRKTCRSLEQALVLMAFFDGISNRAVVNANEDERGNSQPPQIAGMETTGTLDVGYRWTAGFRPRE
jgi:hypothetical protein